jgi:4-amino-4-deoxy-L-arabinose transferase-like glycosyltransferase
VPGTKPAIGKCGLSSGTDPPPNGTFVITFHSQTVPEVEDERSGARGGPFWEILAIAALAVAVRVIHLDALHNTDDYYHILAARSWLRDGTLGLAGGAPYERASLFTYIVAAFMYVFGESSYVARLPGALAGAAWVTLLFVWLRSHAGRTAAWAAALLFCIDPGAIWLSRIVRFYTLHGLVFLAVAIGVYHLATRAEFRPRSAMVGLGVVAGFGVAYHLQVTTVIGAVALAAWLIVVLMPRAIGTVGKWSKGRLAWTLGIGAGTLLLAGVAMIHSGLAADYLWRFQYVPMWAAERQDEVGYYFRRLQRSYPVLVALFPVACVVAIARTGRAGVFCVILFCVPFLLHSLAAFKAQRFLSYAMPFFFAIWGMTIAAVLPALFRAAETTIAQVMAVRAGASWLKVGAGLLLIVMAAGLVYSNRAFEDAYRFVRPGQPPPLGSRPNWAGARPLLKGPADSASIVVGTFGPSIFYNLGRLDVVVGRDQVPVHNGGEFAEARQLGRPAIHTAESMETLIRCHRSGLVVVDWNLWDAEWAMNRELTAVVTARAEPVPLPSGWGIYAYRWDREPPLEPLEDCPELRVRE